MNKEEVIGRVLKATPEQLSAVMSALDQKNIAVTQDRKLLNSTQASKILGVSRTTVWRLAKEGKLKTIETRLGRRRIISQSITDFVLGGNNAPANP